MPRYAIYAMKVSDKLNIDRKGHATVDVTAEQISLEELLQREIVTCAECIFWDARKHVCTNSFGMNGTVTKYDYCSRGKTREQVQEHQE